MLQLVDSEVVMLSAHWEKKRTSLVELQEQLQQLPGLLADLESMTANLSKFYFYLYITFRNENNFGQDWIEIESPLRIH